MIKLYLFKGLGECDYTCGDRIVAAHSMDEAHAIVGNARSGFGADLGVRNDDPQVFEVLDFDYTGPGGG